jgi:hypothetical protein
MAGTVLWRTVYCLTEKTVSFNDHDSQYPPHVQTVTHEINKLLVSKYYRNLVSFSDYARELHSWSDDSLQRERAGLSRDGGRIETEGVYGKCDGQAY